MKSINIRKVIIMDDVNGRVCNKNRLIECCLEKIGEIENTHFNEEEIHKIKLIVSRNEKSIIDFFEE